MRAYVPDFEMSVARHLSDALSLVARGYRPFAGGTDIMVLFNAGKLTPVPLVSVRRLGELRDVRVSPEVVEIGAAVTYSELRHHPLLCDEFPLLVQSSGWTGSIANQNRGTLGGNIANASPAADSSPVLLVYDAELQLVSSTSSKWVAYSSFHLGYKKLALDSGELITAIRLRRNQCATHQYGRKVGTRKAQAISKVSFAAGVFNGSIRIAAGSVGPIPLRCPRTEQLLNSERLTEALMQKAMELLRQDISPITDVRSTGNYRLTVAENLLGEFLEQLL